MVEVMGDSFPSNVRCSGVSISFALAAAFAGLAPTICGYLINVTGYLYAPVVFFVVLCLIALPVAFSLEK
jgi:hypothetical protein